jgi:ornithine carbamoyltransferase
MSSMSRRPRADVNSGISAPLAGKAVGVVLQKRRARAYPSRSRSRLNARPVMMTGPEGAFSRGESVYDTTRVMERYVDAVVIRTYTVSARGGGRDCRSPHQCH